MLSFKNASLILSFLFLFAPLLRAESRKITAVLIEGEQNVKEKVIKSQIKSKVKKFYSDDQVKTDVQNILSLGSIEDVEINLDTATMRLTFSVKEKPFIKKISLKGNKKLSKGKLNDEMTLKQKEFFDASKIDESKSKMLTVYHDKGYADAKIEIIPTIDELANYMTISILITEGNRILIGGVTIEGAKAYKPKKIARMMETKKKKVFKDETIKKDIDTITLFYKNNGYLQVSVGEPKITYNPERTQMFIAVPLEEGQKYRVGAVSFSGNAVYAEKDLRKALVFKTGQVYNEEKFQDSQASMREMYQDKGYWRCVIDPQLDFQKEAGILNINFNTSENEIVYVGSIYIDGLTSTKEFVIRRELALKEGDVFSRSRLVRSMEKINNLGFIDAIDPQFQPTNRPDVTDIVLNVTEGKAGLLTAGVGYSSIDKFVGSLQVQHINLLGRAQRMSLLWEFGEKKQNYEIGWTEPWFMNKPVSLGFDVFDTLRKRDYGSSPVYYYNEGRRGGTVRVGPRLSDYLSLLFAYSYEEIEVSNVDFQIQDSVAASKDITSSLISQIVYDTRDNIYDASRGSRQSLSVQVAGGPFQGDVNFVKPSVKSSWFFPSIWKFVFSMNGTLGLVEPFEPSTDVPIYERFYVGGAESVRGYQYRSEIGPSGGGKMMFVFNAEYKFPIVQEKKRTILQGAFFYDVGGAWKRPEDFVPEIGVEDNQLKSGAGFGIRFTTPVFPLRLDWGHGFNHKPGEDQSQFYFTIGNIF
ncbi:MAG: outer membrane protein assembly factor BamA [Elusimicrobiota bacterium]